MNGEEKGECKGISGKVIPRAPYLSLFPLPFSKPLCRREFLARIALLVDQSQPAKVRELESCGGKNIRALLGPFHLNRPEPVLFGQPERTIEEPRSYKSFSHTTFAISPNLCQGQR